MLVLGLPTATAIGTSLVVIVITAAAGFSAHLGQADLNLVAVGTSTVGAVVASVTAGRLGRHLDDERLRRRFAALVLVVAIGVAASIYVFDNAAIG